MGVALGQENEEAAASGMSSEDVRKVSREDIELVSSSVPLLHS